MIYTMVKMGHLQLMQPSLPVTLEEFGTPELHQLINELWENRAHYDGAGIAAPQMGIFKRVAVVGFKHNKRYEHKGPVPDIVLINPSYEPICNDTEEDWEGCLSVPGLRAQVKRYLHIRYYTYDTYGNLHIAEARGFTARVIQHECDHLNGVLFPSRIVNFSKFGFTDTLPEFAETDLK